MYAAAAADIDAIAHTLDFDSLQDNITNIAFCDIEQELVSMLLCRQLLHVVELISNALWSFGLRSGMTVLIKPHFYLTVGDFIKIRLFI